MKRSSAYPLQVFSDEPPKSAVFVNVAGESVPSASLEIINEKKLELELTATDDIRLVEVRLIHRFAQKDEVLEAIPVSGKFLKQKYLLNMEGWAGGDHEILLEPHDDFQLGHSDSVHILYNDEKSMREKRIRDLEALINDWTHVLADLLESKMDKKMSDSLESRLKGIEYPDMEKDGILAAYVKELKMLSEVICSSPVPSRFTMYSWKS